MYKTHVAVSFPTRHHSWAVVSLLVESVGDRGDPIATPVGVGALHVVSAPGPAAEGTRGQHLETGVDSPRRRVDVRVTGIRPPRRVWDAAIHRSVGTLDAMTE